MNIEKNPIEICMKIMSAEYVKSFTRCSEINLPILPAIAFIGRSNVGKSSLINHLLNRKKLVKTSSTPGKTQLINYFLINNAFYFVDLPGYGYAQVPVKVKNAWLTMITDYLLTTRELKLAVLVVDARHKPPENDLAFKNLLASNQIPYLVVANKSDKLKANQIAKNRSLFQQSFNMNTPPLFHSALKKTGRQEIWDVVERSIND